MKQAGEGRWGRVERARNVARAQAETLQEEVARRKAQVGRERRGGREVGEGLGGGQNGQGGEGAECGAGPGRDTSGGCGQAEGTSEGEGGLFCHAHAAIAAPLHPASSQTCPASLCTSGG